VRVTLVEDSFASCDQEFKSLEEIRNANLRGSKIDGVDFYLDPAAGQLVQEQRTNPRARRPYYGSLLPTWFRTAL